MCKPKVIVSILDVSYEETEVHEFDTESQARAVFARLCKVYQTEYLLQAFESLGMDAETIKKILSDARK